MRHAIRWSLVFTLFILFTATPVQAREGFSISLGAGYGAWSLSGNNLKGSLAKLDPPRYDHRQLMNSMEDGLAVRFALAYNILGYASVELDGTAHGWNLGNLDAIGGSGHFSLCAHFHPFQLFMPERDFDASVFLGGGYSIIGGGYEDDDLSRGLDGGTLEFGLTGRYFFTPWFSLGADFRFSAPFYKRWFVDWEDDETYHLGSAPGALFFSATVVTTFHFVAG